MKTILIPTDFNASTLKCIPQVCSNMKGTPVNIVFVHLFRLSDSITDLLMLSRRSREFEYVSADFHKGCHELKRQLPDIKSFSIEFFYGTTLSMFRNFLEANEVDYILHPDFCSCEKLNKTSIDPSALIAKCGLPVLNLLKKREDSFAQSVQVQEEESLMVV